ncbi:hypothetical protein [Polynucleobacter sp. es-EL-1]|nr:hypothetical protein [Polynucleobacter sp. es-EL-1]QWE10573.1 hypothetical protein FD974_09625 [Polynucleobacter sp. es-EL-1]
MLLRPNSIDAVLDGLLIVTYQLLYRQLNDNHVEQHAENMTALARH